MELLVVVKYTVTIINIVAFTCRAYGELIDVLVDLAQQEKL